MFMRTGADQLVGSMMPRCLESAQGRDGSSTAPRTRSLPEWPCCPHCACSSGSCHHSRSLVKGKLFVFRRVSLGWRCRGGRRVLLTEVIEDRGAEPGDAEVCFTFCVCVESLLSLSLSLSHAGTALAWKCMVCHTRDFGRQMGLAAAAKSLRSFSRLLSRCLLLPSPSPTDKIPSTRHPPIHDRLIPLYYLISLRARNHVRLQTF